MQAVILAGGTGTRLRPYTATLPKPLVPVGQYPIIEIVLRQLKHFRFNEVVISTGYLAQLIEAYCGNGKRWGLRIRYVHEEKPLGTSGALKLISGLNRNFLTINGDILTTLDFRSLFDFHCRANSMATLGVCLRQSKVDFGVIHLDGKNSLTGYDEKPSFRYLVSMGVNVFNRQALEYIEKDEPLGIPDLITRLRAGGRRVLGFRNKAQWLDIGRPEDYEAVQELFSSPRKRARYLHG